ncbi:hypothetical protein K437DRAFT_256701 [Tilletiaria anomala UBC 951]|uniref:NAD(P)-binding protein n=1 Tax=Tilletiaria anomala (strain ATCC 24038 / CBS 436.72 / UBC 951) TaxID=1037660 RepID=A0A066W2E6_TILAU|nr:uncharacterized protein K437DRAFT_256701 [Tilletiaria anomala UBC 951]KDN45254.1 hypothetical protein K437DRAFT_256701 [Tilletiaria anomala UBC 951]
MAPFNVLVVGGNGFLGSAICKALLSHSSAPAVTAAATGAGASLSMPLPKHGEIRVTSVSPSGRPFVSPAGHRPAWSLSTNMRWEKGDVVRSPLSSPDLGSPQHHLAQLVDEADAIVHTVGILLESDYKPAASSPSSSRHGTNSGSFGEIARGVLRGWGISDNSNPLRERPLTGKGKEREMTYENMNTRAALNVANLFASKLQRLSKSESSYSSSEQKTQPTFVYISASDIFQPFISRRYIESKREAERGISELAAQYLQKSGSSYITGGDVHQSLFKPIFMRPGLMYHPHTRPLSTLPAALLDLSSSLHASIARNLPFLPTPASLLLNPHSPLNTSSSEEARRSLARLLTSAPLHVDTVAKAVVQSVLDTGVAPGAKDVEEIKRLAGWNLPEDATAASTAFGTAQTHANGNAHL